MVELRKRLNNGDLLIRTEEGIYFIEEVGNSLPLMISKEEGEKILNEDSNSTKVAQK